VEPTASAASRSGGSGVRGTVGIVTRMFFGESRRHGHAGRRVGRLLGRVSRGCDTRGTAFGLHATVVTKKP